ncbi:MAG TPA: response regulator [Sphingobium sp.]|uniref:response regulator n=1 Tax=Sphingobium sp. TaxID=1912891 RepID=UPI002ED19D11
MARPADICRVLVVEDEYILAESLRMRLEDEGFEVIGPAFSAEEAVELVTSDHRIDAAIVDLELKGVIGLNVIDALVDRGIPLLVVSGHDLLQLPAPYRTLPVCRKPLLAGNISERIRRLIEERRSAT